MMDSIDVKVVEKVLLVLLSVTSSKVLEIPAADPTTVIVIVDIAAVTTAFIPEKLVGVTLNGS